MKKAYLGSVFLLASIIFFSAAGINSIYTIAQETDGDTTADITDTTTQTTGNETALRTQQNHTQICAPGLSGTMENIPWSDQGAASTGEDQTRYPALIVDLESLTNENHCYRDEFKTTDHTQIVLMSLRPGEEIGLEVHNTLDQLLFFVQGSGMANVSGQTFPIEEGDLAFIPAGTVHNFVNTGGTDLKLYTTYSPRNHEPGTLQETKADEAGYTPAGKVEEEIEVEN